MFRSDKSKGITPLEALFCILAILGMIVGIYATGRSLGVETGRDEVTAFEHYEREKESALQSCINIVGKNAVQCATEAMESAQEKSETRQGLYAQQDAARWGFWAMMIAAGSTLVTAFGTILLYKQIVLTRKAVLDTGKATEAMLRQNEIAEQAQRPWIEIKSVSVEKCGPLAEPNYEFVINSVIKVVNHGATTANIKLIYAMHLDYFMPQLSNIRNCFSEIQSLRAKSDVVFPGVEKCIPIQAMVDWPPSLVVSDPCLVVLIDYTGHDSPCHATGRIFRIGRVIYNYNQFGLTRENLDNYNFMAVEIGDLAITN